MKVRVRWVLLPLTVAAGAALVSRRQPPPAGPPELDEHHLHGIEKKLDVLMARQEAEAAEQLARTRFDHRLRVATEIAHILGLFGAVTLAMYIAILSLMTSLELAVGIDYRDAIEPGWLDAGLVAGVATVLSASALIVWAVYKLEKQLRKMGAEE